MREVTDRYLYFLFLKVMFVFTVSGLVLSNLIQMNESDANIIAFVLAFSVLIPIIAQIIITDRRKTAVDTRATRWKSLAVIALVIIGVYICGLLVISKTGLTSDLYMIGILACVPIMILIVVSFWVNNHTFKMTKI